MRAETINAAIATLSPADSGALEDALATWCNDTWPGTVLHSVRGKPSSGASSELVFLDISRRGKPGIETLVLRLNSRWPVYPLEDLYHQGRCLDVLARGLPAGLRVPSVEAVETRSLPGIGRAFLAMSHVDGRPAPDQPSYVLQGWLHDLGDQDREFLWREGVSAIAAVHASPLSDEESKALRLPVSGDTALARMLNYWALFLSHVEKYGTYPALRSAVAWLQSYPPRDVNEPCLVWGDASLRNMLFDGLSPSVLLDFEFSHVGLRELDVAFYPLMDYVMAAGFANGAERLGGFAGLSDTMDCYQQLTGQAIGHRDYFLRMALTYMALSTTRVYQRLAVSGDISMQAVHQNPPLQLLEEVMLDKRRLPV